MKIRPKNEIVPCGLVIKSLLGDQPMPFHRDSLFLCTYINTKESKSHETKWIELTIFDLCSSAHFQKRKNNWEAIHTVSTKKTEKVMLCYVKLGLNVQVLREYVISKNMY